jgi:hypothetical protein
VAAADVVAEVVATDVLAAVVELGGEAEVDAEADDDVDVDVDAVMVLVTVELPQAQRTAATTAARTRPSKRLRKGFTSLPSRRNGPRICSPLSRPSLDPGVDPNF